MIMTENNLFFTSVLQASLRLLLIMPVKVWFVTFPNNRSKAKV